MSQSFKVFFFVKKGRNSKLNSLPIYVRVTVEGKRVEWSLQRKCEPGFKWNQTLGRATVTKEEAKNLNVYLDVIQGKYI